MGCVGGVGVVWGVFCLGGGHLSFPVLSANSHPFNTHTTEANSKKKREDTVLPPALSLEIAGSQLKPLGRTEDKIYTKIKA